MLCFIAAFMLKTQFRLFAVFLALSLTALGDTFILKSGEKVEGKVLSETDKEITLQIAVTATIKDERVIKKADLDKVEKVALDEQAWPALKTLALGEASLELADYTQAITTLTAFIKQFPESAHAAEAKAKLALFEAEKQRVEAGELKVSGKWLSAAQAEQEKVQMAGDILLARMKRFAAAAQYVEAMNTFDKMEKSFPGSAAMPDAIEIARQAIPAIKLAAEQRQTQLKQSVLENATRLTNSKGPERQQIETMQKQNIAAMDAAVAAAERSGATWLPLSPSNERSITALITKCGTELTRISALPVDKMRLSLKAVAKAKAAFEASDLPEADKALTEANNAWPANEQIKRLQQKLAEERKRIAAEAKAAEEARVAAAKAAADKVAAAKVEAAKAHAEAVKAKEALDAAKAAEDEAAEKQREKEKQDRIIKYSLIAIPVILLVVILLRKKARDTSEVQPQSPAAEVSPAEDSTAE